MTNQNDVKKYPPNCHTVNPLIITENTRALISFLEQVFGAVEDPNALAISDSDGKIFNSSIVIGDTSIIIFDRKEGWKHMPSLLQVSVDNIDEKLNKAIELGAELITKPTDFYGGKLARFIDPQKNLWWLFELSDYDESDWGDAEGSYDYEEEYDNIWRTDENADPQMTYIHNSLVEGLKKL